MHLWTTHRRRSKSLSRRAPRAVARVWALRGDAAGPAAPAAAVADWSAEAEAAASDADAATSEAAASDADAAASEAVSDAESCEEDARDMLESSESSMAPCRSVRISSSSAGEGRARLAPTEKS